MPGDTEGGVAAVATRGGCGHSSNCGGRVVRAAGGQAGAHRREVGGDCTMLVNRDQWSDELWGRVTRIDAHVGATPKTTNQSTVPHSTQGALMEEAREDQEDA